MSQRQFIPISSLFTHAQPNAETPINARLNVTLVGVTAVLKEAKVDEMCCMLWFV